MKMLNTEAWVSFPGWRYSVHIVTHQLYPEDIGGFILVTDPDSVLWVSSLAVPFTWYKQ